MNTITETILERAVKDLSKALREDPEYFYSWQSNIAMAYMDEFNKKPQKYFKQEELHEIANTAAKTFLNILISE
jgi:Tfp pilus assembly protein PilF